VLDYTRFYRFEYYIQLSISLSSDLLYQILEKHFNSLSQLSSLLLSEYERILFLLIMAMTALQNSPRLLHFSQISNGPADLDDTGFGV
jgi:hypothetical protein